MDAERTHAALGARDALACVSVFLIVVATSAAGGAYTSSAWGWTALAALWVGALALVFTTPRLGRLELTTLAAISAVLALTALSLLWTSSGWRSIEEVQRTLVYVSAVGAFLLLARRVAVLWLTTSVWLAISIVCGYALGTRVFPDRLGVIDLLAGNRLSTPIGYWNALAVFAAMGSVVAIGLAARAQRSWLRALAAASLLVLLPTLYFTFSRGGWIALGAGAAAAVALDPRRLQLLTTLIVVGPAPAAGLVFAYRSEALSRVQPELADATDAGHRLALILGVLAVVNAVAGFALALVERRVAPGRPLRVAFAAALVLVAAVALVGLFERFGAPTTLASKAYDAFAAPAPAVEGSLNQRLFNFSGNNRLPQWRVAWEQYQESPWRGTGAGTYEQYWLRDRTSPAKVRDAHMLYLETLAELGPAGLALLTLALVVPLVAAARSRATPIVPALFGAFCAYLAHAAVDWDWEIPAVTLTALFLGGSTLVAARPRTAPAVAGSARVAGVGVALALAAFAAVGLAGNTAAADAEAAVARGDWQRVERRADRAEAWAPWDGRPWSLLGEAATARGDLRLARERFAEAVERDPNEWSFWFRLAQAETGRERKASLDVARRLNPLSPELRELAARP